MRHSPFSPRWRCRPSRCRACCTWRRICATRTATQRPTARMPARLVAAHDVPPELRLAAMALMLESVRAAPQREAPQREVAQREAVTGGGGGGVRAVDDDDFARARASERSAHEASTSVASYRANVLRCALNCRTHSRNAGLHLARASDEALMRGTLLERIRTTEDDRRTLFQHMLREKYESISASATCDTSLKCRRCNGVDVAWEQKQTRSADEAATVYCVCATCHNRWTIRG